MDELWNPPVCTLCSRIVALLRIPSGIDPHRLKTCPETTLFRRAASLALEHFDCQQARELIRSASSVKSPVESFLVVSGPIVLSVAEAVNLRDRSDDEMGGDAAPSRWPGYVKVVKKQILKTQSPGECRLDPGAEITRIGRFISDIYDLDLDLTGDDFLISAELARSLLPGPSPRTGMLVIEHAEELQLGVYLDPNDRDDPATLVEEASHLVCLLWHAAHDLPVSVLILELQSEIDRFLYFCHKSGHLSFDCFELEGWADWIDDETRGRYEVAHQRAYRYCRTLARRFGDRCDTEGLVRELRRFYRASPETKLAS